jgi:hypothetical protein
MKNKHVLIILAILAGLNSLFCIIFLIKESRNSSRLVRLEESFNERLKDYDNRNNKQMAIQDSVNSNLSNDILSIKNNAQLEISNINMIIQKIRKTILDLDNNTIKKTNRTNDKSGQSSKPSGSPE